MQTLSTQFETLKMKREEYFLRVDEIVKSIIGIGDTIKEKSVLQIIEKTIPTWLNPKVSVLEDISDMDDLTKGELYGILIEYRMRT